MTMIEDALEWVQTVSMKAHGRMIEKDAEGNEYQVGSILNHLPSPPTPRSLTAHSLTGAIQYLKTGECPGGIIELDEDSLSIHGPLGVLATRPRYLQASPHIPPHPFGEWLSLERFNVWLLTAFVDDESIRSILGITGKIVSENVRAEGDDGMTSSVEIRRGVAAVERANIGPVVHLRPQCTWSEIEQPIRPFIIRIRAEGEIRVALFEGYDAWRKLATEDASAWIRRALEIAEITGVTILG